MRDVAQITWVLGVLVQPEARFLEACQQAVARRMGQASVVDMVNLVWAYAWLGTPPPGPCMQMHTAGVRPNSPFMAALDLCTLAQARRTQKPMLAPAASAGCRGHPAHHAEGCGASIQYP